MKLLFLLSVGAFIVLVANSDKATAQAPPPHYAGTVCYTSTFWCWSPRPGRVGDSCSCPSPQGWVKGVLG